ncbi:hypothetical protein CEXT_67481 [Caerostris extrusa]|uniref:Uncharacterized protein n=1 Tax=Caerostris extrusa TaxID=172846 RepID=A0AAV4XQG4_CAEEX|nr:hypothetical protein CEXT_67481 [Caerostris extrusa]
MKLTKTVLEEQCTQKCQKAVQEELVLRIHARGAFRPLRCAAPLWAPNAPYSNLSAFGASQRGKKFLGTTEDSVWGRITIPKVAWEIG